MIYVTGDCHGNFSKFTLKNFPEQKNMTKNDFVIICGDFGGIWQQENTIGKEQEDQKLDWLNDRPFTTLFVDGNHENYDRLNSFPVEEWHGGKVHFVRPSIIHLMRGQIFNIDGLTFFAFGGARSHDIRDGILDPNDSEFERKFFHMRRNPFCQFRVNHYSWWKEEMPTFEEMKEGRENLSKLNNKVDIIITHDAPGRMYSKIGFRSYDPNELTDYLTEIQLKTEHRMWYCGHHHVDKCLNLCFEVIYDKIERIFG